MNCEHLLALLRKKKKYHVYLARPKKPSLVSLNGLMLKRTY
jgi:hypothetical protein